MKVLLLPKYGRKAASARYRFLQYLPFLDAAGIEYHVSPLFDDAYLEHKFATGRAGAVSLAKALLRRTWAVAMAERYDLAVIHCEAFPYLPPFFERFLVARGVPYILDYDDAIFHSYDQHPRAFVRNVLSDKIRDVVKGAAWVLAGSQYLADFAAKVTPRVEVLPTVIDLRHYELRPEPVLRTKPFTIGWIGSPSTAHYLNTVAAPLRDFCQEANARVVLVGSGPVNLPSVPVEIRPWSEEHEFEYLKGFNVGIMPLPDTPWTRGKCGFKLIQYMAAGLPVVASPIGVNNEIVESGTNGYLAADEAAWVSALRGLRERPELRASMGAAGRSKVEREYCVQVTAPRFIARLMSVAKR